MKNKIDVIDYDDGLPVSIIVPLSKKREKFFFDFVFPLLEANEVLEIIINYSNGNAPKKRNDGFDKSTQPFVFFCDDDILLPSDHIPTLYKTLVQDNPNKSYAYSGYKGIVLNPATHPMRGNFNIPTKEFNATALKTANYISTMSLIRREHFTRFDENLKRLQDWDLWLTMLKRGYEGVAVHNNEFFAYYLDEGITSNTNNERDAVMKIYEKHKLGSW